MGFNGNSTKLEIIFPFRFIEFEVELRKLILIFLKKFNKTFLNLKLYWE